MSLLSWTGRAAAVAAVGLLAACAGGYSANYQPVVDFGASRAPQSAYPAALAQCRQMASQRSAAINAAQKGAGAALAGGAAGALTGSMGADLGKGAALGAGLGAIGGLAAGAMEGIGQEQDIIIQCLRNRGYNVISR